VISVALLTVLPPPLMSPLFPYTTLFRSCRAHAARRLLRAAHGRGGGIGGDRERDRAGRARDDGSVVHPGSRRLGLCGRDARLIQDRKSTRLNSSHGSISYAVFCFQTTTT